jgi:hypothetical protein
MSAPSGKRSVSVGHAVAYGLLTAIGLYALVVALGYGLFHEEWRVGPGLVPAVVGAGISLIAGWELVATLRGRRARHDHGIAEVAASVAPVSPAPAAWEAGGSPAADPVAEATHGGGTASPGAPTDDVDIYGRTAATRARQLVVVVSSLVVAVLLVPVLGFLVAFLLLSVFISAVVERRRWLPSLVISLVAVLAVYAVFVLFLEVPLPTGLLGIGG